MKEAKCGVAGKIKFEVSVVKSKEARTGFKFFIADASGNYAKESISKITFEIAGPGINPQLYNMLWLKQP